MNLDEHTRRQLTLALDDAVLHNQEGNWEELESLLEHARELVLRGRQARTVLRRMEGSMFVRGSGMPIDNGLMHLATADTTERYIILDGRTLQTMDTVCEGRFNAGSDDGFTFEESEFEKAPKRCGECARWVDAKNKAEATCSGSTDPEDHDWKDWMEDQWVQKETGQENAIRHRSCTGCPAMMHDPDQMRGSSAQKELDDAQVSNLLTGSSSEKFTVQRFCGCGPEWARGPPVVHVEGCPKAGGDGQ